MGFGPQSSDFRGLSISAWKSAFLMLQGRRHFAKPSQRYGCAYSVYLLQTLTLAYRKPMQFNGILIPVAVSRALEMLDGTKEQVMHGTLYNSNTGFHG